MSCSQDEQFFINGYLPDFHQVDIPDIWIGLSGTLQTIRFNVYCERTLKKILSWQMWLLKTPFLLIFLFVMLPDKDQDGKFKWVDKSDITFSNYGPGWPRNTAGLWDCGQIFTGKICTLPLWPLTHTSKSFQSRLALQNQQQSLFFTSRKLWWQMGNNQLL